MSVGSPRFLLKFQCYPSPQRGPHRGIAHSRCGEPMPVCMTLPLCSYVSCVYVCVRPAALWAGLTFPWSCGPALSPVQPVSCTWEKLWFKCAVVGLSVPAPFQWGRQRWQGSL